MICKRLFLVLVLLFVLAASPVSAVNVSLSNLGYGPNQDVQIYAPNGSMLWSGNTSSINAPVPDFDFYMVLKPTTSNPLSDPTTFMATALSFIQSNVIGLVVGMFVIGLIIRRV